jgi:hypothetical protein
MTLLLSPELSAPFATTVSLVARPAPPPKDPGGQGEDYGKSSPVGLVILLLFFVAVGLLVRSMNKHLRRVPESFEGPAFEEPKRQGGND